MSDFVVVCIGILTLTHLVALLLLVLILLHVRHASRAVELAGYEAYNQFARIGDATLKMSEFAATVRSGWMRALTLALGAVTTMWPMPKDGQQDRG